MNVPFVRPQMASLAEGLATYFTGIGLFSSVNTEVKLEAVGVVEFFFTGRALEWLVCGVSAAVGDQAALLAEGFATLLATEGPLAGVDTAMDLKIHSLSKRLPAKVTPIGPQVTMDPLVVFQVNGMPE